MKLLTWNIHQQGGAGGGRIPPFVKDEIIGADIAALTECCTNSAGEGRQAFISDMTREGFCCAASENVGGNDILIAVKSGYPILDCSWAPCWGVDSIPENLRVDLDCGGTVLTVAAIRIKSLDGIKSPAEKNRLRRQEFCWALDWLKDIKNPVLLTGDWNNNRRGSENQDYLIIANTWTQIITAFTA